MRDNAPVRKFRLYNKDTNQMIGVLFSCYDDETYRKAALDHVWGKGDDSVKGVYTMQRLEEDGTWTDTELTRKGKFKL